MQNSPRQPGYFLKESVLVRRLLFLVIVSLAIGLAAAVAISPLLPDDAAAEGWGRLVPLFAQDQAVRRTTLASAAGLLATAFVLFRPKKTVKPTPS